LLEVLGKEYLTLFPTCAPSAPSSQAGGRSQTPWLHGGECDPRPGLWPHSCAADPQPDWSTTPPCC